MAKLELSDINPCTRRRGRPNRSVLRVLLIAAALGLVTAEGTQASMREGFAIGPLPQHSRWRVSIPAKGGHASATLAASETWTVHRAVHRQPRATLTIRCESGADLAAYVSFHDRDSREHAVLRYRFARRSPPRLPSPHQPRGTPEWLGGNGFVREMIKAEFLDVMIEDVGFGVSEAVFLLAGAAAAVRRLESACRAEPRHHTAPSSAPPRQEPRQQMGRPSVPRSPQTAPDQSPSRRPGVPRRLQPEPVPLPTPAPAGQQPEKPDPASAATPEAASTPGIAPEQAGPSGERSPGTMAPAEPSPVPEQPQPQPAPSPGEPDQPHKIPGEDGTTSMPAPVAEAPPEPPPREAEPPESARLAAFLKRHGPNRKGELIYDWYRQCLDHAGVDSRQVWYLSGDELTYRSKGQTDEVRLSVLVSTTRDLAVPPRRITCHGTARGREITIDRSE